MENIGLQDSLLSRFDLLFVMLDVIDSDVDQMISDHVVRMHRYRNPKEADGEPLTMGSSYADSLAFVSNTDQVHSAHQLTSICFFNSLLLFISQKKDTEVYEKYDALLHGKSRKRHEKILSVEFMRKYIHIAKCMKPKLTEQACEAISNEYSRLRSQEALESDVARTQPITARTLETLIRLSTAHARARMSKTVTIDDAHAAIELVQFAYFKKVLEKERGSKRRRNGAGSGSDEDEEHTNADTATRSPSRRTKRTRIEQDPAYDSDEDVETPQPDAGDLTRRETRRSLPAQKHSEATSSSITSQSQTGSSEAQTEGTVAATPASITDARLGIFKNGLQRLFREAREQSLSLSRITASINENNPEPFTGGEIDAAMHRMTEDNQIMVADDIVFLI